MNSIATPKAYTCAPGVTPLITTDWGPKLNVKLLAARLAGVSKRNSKTGFNAVKCYSSPENTAAQCRLRARSFLIILELSDFKQKEVAAAMRSTAIQYVGIGAAKTAKDLVSRDPSPAPRGQDDEIVRSPRLERSASHRRLPRTSAPLAGSIVWSAPSRNSHAIPDRISVAPDRPHRRPGYRMRSVPRQRCSSPREEENTPPGGLRIAE